MHINALLSFMLDRLEFLLAVWPTHVFVYGCTGLSVCGCVSVSQCHFSDAAVDTMTIGEWGCSW